VQRLKGATVQRRRKAVKAVETVKALKEYDNQRIVPIVQYLIPDACRLQPEIPAKSAGKFPFYL
jgi:hypothetical protein